MKNSIECKNCKSESPFHKLKCDNCGALLRTRVVNLDLFSTIWKLIETPSKAFANIIHAEHKNYLILILSLFGLRFFILSLTLSQANNENTYSLLFKLPNFALSFVYLLIFMFLTSFITTQLNKIVDVKSRLRDNLSIYTYSLIPMLFGLFFLFPIEYAIFGEFAVTFAPSPFLLNPSISITLAIIEGLMLVWSFMLSIVATYTQTKNILYSLIVGSGFIGGLIYIAIYLPLFPF